MTNFEITWVEAKIAVLGLLIMFVLSKLYGIACRMDDEEDGE